jgi:eukaryotic-like serine/threonine-protein kinase
MLTAGDLKSGRYRVVRPLGGAMKRVYLAEDLRLSKRNCALAEMIDTFSDDQARSAAITAFEREVRILASLDHPNIPRVLDAFSENDRHYLITEFVPGSTLEDVETRRGGQLSHYEVR